MVIKSVILGLIMGYTLPASAAEDSTVGTILSHPSSPRAGAMGEAYSSADDDVLGLQYNPAVDLKTKQLALLYEKGFEDSLQTIGFGMPVSFGKVAGTFIYHDGGSIDLIDTAGNTRKVNAQRDILAVGTAGFNPRSNVSVGGSAKILHSQLVSEFSGTAYLADFGAILRASSRLRLGLAIQNIGTGLKYRSTSETLPRMMRAGASYTLKELSHRATFAFDEVVLMNDGSPKEHLGLEYVFANTFAVRFGYKVGYDVASWSTGCGLMIDRVSFDFSFVPASSLGNTEKASLTFRF
jgi:hypothetical protein